MRKFYNYIATVYTTGTQTVKGSLVESKVIKYRNINVALWKNTRSYRESTLWVQTDSNEFEVNFQPQHPVNVWDRISLKIWEFKIDQVVEHHNAKGKLDNLQAFISPTT